MKLYRNLFFMLLVLFSKIYAEEIHSNEFIIKFKPNKIQTKLLISGQISEKQLKHDMMKPLDLHQINQLKNIAQLALTEEKNIHLANGAHLVKINGTISMQAYLKILDEFNHDSQIEYAEPVSYFQHMAEFNAQQWDMFNNSGDSFLLVESNKRIQNLPYQGDNVVVAVIDTGYTPHINYINNLIPYVGQTCLSKNGYNTQCYGYQFISSCETANETKRCLPDDTIAYKPDGLDVGDYTTTKKSSWHGSHVTGIIVANGYDNLINPKTILGGASRAKILPIRVLGAGGGTNYDVANAIYWAVDEYDEIKNNNPAQVINLSLGGVSSCSKFLQDAINTALLKGAIVVAAAGNSKIDVSRNSPANCNGVISVSAKNANNELSSYSNYGNTTITASGGDYSDGGVLSTIWGSSYAYNYNSNAYYARYRGTSMATPHVVATIADMIEYFNQNKINYNTGLIVKILKLSSGTLDKNSNLFGKVSGTTLDTLKAINYMQQHVLLRLLPNKNIYYIKDMSQQTVNFTNHSNNDVYVNKLEILNDNNTLIDNIKINSNNCINKQLSSNQSCQLVFSNKSSYAYSGAINLLGKDDDVIGTVAFNVSPDTETSTSTLGGCSLVNGSDDYFLLTIFIFLVIVFVYRKVSEHD
jgi:subtilisin family serine protease